MGAAGPLSGGAQGGFQRAPQFAARVLWCARAPPLQTASLLRSAPSLRAGPGCRSPYGSEFQVSLVRRVEELVPASAPPAAQPTAAAPCARATSGGGGGSGSGGVAASAAPAPSATPASPARDLHFEQEQLWPSLSSAAQSAKGSATATTSRHTSPRDTPSPPPVKTTRGSKAAPQPALQLDGEGSTAGSCSSATSATTPQSPASSVVSYRARTASSVVEQLQGTCHVSLAPGALPAPAVDEEGAALAASLQQAVRAGSLSVRQAAASLVAYLRQKQAPPAVLPGLQLQLLAGPTGAGSAAGLAAAAGRMNAQSGGGLFAGASPGERLDSSLASGGALTFSQWAHTDSSAPSARSSGGLGLFDGWGPSTSMQQQRQLLQQPARTRLPLYARGAAQGAAAAGPGMGFPGFQASDAASPAAPPRQPARQVGSPPGFSRSMFQQQAPQLVS